MSAQHDSDAEKLLKAPPPPDEAAPELHDFGWALQQMKADRFVRRYAWRTWRTFIGIRRPYFTVAPENIDAPLREANRNLRVTESFIFLNTSQNELIPFNISALDLLVEDWELAD